MSLEPPSAMKTMHVPVLMSCLVIASSLVAQARDELGTFESAHKAYPDAFVPGNVAVVDFNGVRWYAFAGEAEQCFSGKFAEAESELFEEATLDAKANFLESLSKGDPRAKVTMSGLRTAYQYADGAFRRVVCVVPIDSVSVSSPPASTAPSASPAVVSPEESHQAETRAAEVVNMPIRAEKTDIAESASVQEADKGVSWEMRLRKCRERIRHNPKDFTLYRRMARIQIEGGFPSKANRCYGRMVALLADDASMSDADKAPLYLEAAEFARDNGRPSDALKRFRLLSKLGLPGYAQQATGEIATLLLRTQ